MRPERWDEADYVVVGAGSAGCVVAARLAAAGHQVVLLEAGRADGTFLTRTPGMISMMHTVPQLKKRIDWGYATVPQPSALGREIWQTRGRGVGGSSSINGMLWVRGARADYDAWAADGCTGWDASETTRLYRRIEDWEGGADPFRGAGGPVKVTRKAQPTEASTDFIGAASERLGLAINDDYNGAEQLGVSSFQQNVADGERYSASRAYLTGQDLPTLQVQTRTHALRPVIEAGRAVGVEVADTSDHGPRPGSQRTIRARHDVILAAGTFGSPQLLMLAGVGPAEHLGDLGIDVVADLPVGQNLHDHLFVPTSWDVPGAQHLPSPLYVGRNLARRAARRSSFFDDSLIEAVAFLRTSHATGPADLPDLQLHVVPWAYPSPNSDGPGFDKVESLRSLTVMSTLLHPRSRGSLRLATPDPAAAPLIDPAYLSEQHDVEVLVEGIDRIREIMLGSGMTLGPRREFAPGAGAADLDHEVRLRAMTVYHPVGTCRMGADDAAVVDSELRVRGIAGLRVADASVMPTIISGNTNAPSMMIGEKCAELILGETAVSPREGRSASP
ncbi:GMC family oxidoreductase [Nocardioides dongkuii]|uniref:GMC family oxidoreductase n=1 Tax=Nocardioides dongkuii TaxID=2760089 RepID=UPI001878E254|nr:FAD-dependent oxidoreductase [Nocardioides dongkuii]